MAGEKKSSGLMPLDSFCCGCPLDLGIQIILIVHTLVSCFYIYTAISNIILELPTLGFGVSEVTQAFNCGFAIASLAFIVSGFLGLRSQTETHLRLYLMWLMLSFCLDAFFLGMLVYKNSCSSPNPLDTTTASYACGAVRITDLSFTATFLGTMIYAIFIVWSRCEQLKAASSDDPFTGLVRNVRQAKMAEVQKSVASAGLFGTGPLFVYEPTPVQYGSLATPTIGGGTAIFGGRLHDTNFPPIAA